MILASGGGHRGTAAQDNAHFEFALDTLAWTRPLNRTLDANARAWNSATSARENIPDVAIFNVPQEDGRAGCTHTYDNIHWLPPGVTGAGSVKGGLFIGNWVRSVVNLDTNTWGAPHWHSDVTTQLDWSNSAGMYMNGALYSITKSGFMLRKFDTTQNEATDWPYATSFGKQTNIANGPQFTSAKIWIAMPERGEFALLGNSGAHLRFRLQGMLTAGSTNAATYTDALTLTSADGSHADFGVSGNFTDATGKLFSAGAAYDHDTATVYVAENPNGGSIYKITGIGTNTWTTQRIVGATTISASVNGTYGRWRLGRIAGQLIAVRVTTISALAQIIRLE